MGDDQPLALFDEIRNGPDRLRCQMELVLHCRIHIGANQRVASHGHNADLAFGHMVSRLDPNRNCISIEDKKGSSTQKNHHCQLLKPNGTESFGQCRTQRNRNETDRYGRQIQGQHLR